MNTNNNARTMGIQVRKVYTVEDIMAILGIGRNSAYALVREGHFKVVRVGASIRVSKKSFDEWPDSGDDTGCLLM